jgi:hypothetical protein
MKNEGRSEKGGEKNKKIVRNVKYEYVKDGENVKLY